jgi:hypothetical protein
MDNSEKTQRYKRGENPNSRKNLKPFEKGKSGNPEGPVPGYKHRRTTLEKWAYIEYDIVNPITKDKEKGTADDEVHLAWLRECRKGNMVAIKEYLDTLHGKLSDKTEVTGKDGGPVQTENKHDLTSLSVDDLIALKKLQSKVNG